MARLIEPTIFKQFPEVRAAMTTRGSGSDPMRENYSISVGDDPKRVTALREKLVGRLGFTPDRLALQHQIHTDQIAHVADGYQLGKSDAMYTLDKGWLLGVSIADCTPVLLHDPVTGVVAAVHSGWRGSAAGISRKVIGHLHDKVGVSPSDLYAWIGPCAGVCCYQVGEEVAEQFATLYSRPDGQGKYLFDNRRVVLDQLLKSGVGADHIELERTCTICDGRFHSYRRDGEKSGRMLGLIGRPSTPSVTP